VLHTSILKCNGKMDASCDDGHVEKKSRTSKHDVMKADFSSFIHYFHFYFFSFLFFSCNLK
jgi:hypothetical protein